MTLIDFPGDFPAAASCPPRPRPAPARSAPSRCPISAAPPTGRRSPMACSPAMSAPMAAWCGRARTGPRKCWSRWPPQSRSRNARALPPIAALPESDFTAKMLLENLPSGQDIFYRVRFRDLSHPDISSEPVVGRFRTAPGDRRDVSFVWGGDVAGQGWGINPDDGGMFTYATMRKHRPDFLLHSGDTIYADGMISAEVKLPDGKIWKNLTIPEKAKVAETLDEFRAAHKYNFLDDNLRAFNAEVPIFVQWDDHEVMNNWSASKEIPAAYKVRDITLLAARASRAFHEMYPMRESIVEPGRVYRTLSYGPHLDVFMLDERSYRGAQRSEPADRLRSRQLLPRTRPARLAEAGAVEFARHLEGDRLRHAAQPHRL